MVTEFENQKKKNLPLADHTLKLTNLRLTNYLSPALSLIFILTLK